VLQYQKDPKVIKTCNLNGAMYASSLQRSLCTVGFVKSGAQKKSQRGGAEFAHDETVAVAFFSAYL
jgi:hypothetical protein